MVEQDSWVADPPLVHIQKLEAKIRWQSNRMKLLQAKNERLTAEVDRLSRCIEGKLAFNKSITDTTESMLRAKIKRLEDLILEIREQLDPAGLSLAACYKLADEADAIRERRKNG